MGIYLRNRNRTETKTENIDLVIENV